LEQLIADSLKPLELPESEIQAIAEALLELPPRSIRRTLHLPASENSFFENGSRVPWHRDGYWWDESKGRPGAELLYAAGGYFIQDAASMLPLSLLQPAPGEMICDLCAAPGGKATAIAEALAQDGWLLANETIESRLAPLELNLARTGTNRYIVSSCDPEELSMQLPQQFDALLVDAPCSGQTLIGKGKQSLSSISRSTIELNGARQQRILDAAAVMVKPGGRMVYSTCTLATYENEFQIQSFLERHPNWRIETRDELATRLLLQNSRSTIDEILKLESPIAAGCYRLWPHRDRCAGGFAASMICTDSPFSSQQSTSNFEPIDSPSPSHRDLERQPNRTYRKNISRNRDRSQRDRGNRSGELLETLELEQWGEVGEKSFHTGANQVFGWPELPPEKLLSLLKGGPEIAYQKGTQWNPSHGLAMRPLGRWQPKQTVELDATQAKRFMAGESLSPIYGQGWVVATWHNLPLGWLKVVGGTGKNHLPKAARMNIT
jgi:16S rRNA C967 or C1407 C5-methylase (RsmB/RsmF family)/NOL1/NOP2/fmu family ribosome biogenesis protein